MGFFGKSEAQIADTIIRIMTGHNSGYPSSTKVHNEDDEGTLIQDIAGTTELTRIMISDFKTVKEASDVTCVASININSIGAKGLIYYDCTYDDDRIENYKLKILVDKIFQISISSTDDEDNYSLMETNYIECDREYKFWKWVRSKHKRMRKVVDAAEVAKYLYLYNADLCRYIDTHLNAVERALKGNDGVRRIIKKKMAKNPMPADIIRKIDNMHLHVFLKMIGADEGLYENMDASDRWDRVQFGYMEYCNPVNEIYPFIPFWRVIKCEL